MKTLFNGEFKMPKISIIVPVYNSKKHLKECLNSLLNQTFKDIEIILIDDGSFDGSEKLCDIYANIDKRIIVKHQKNQGVSSARNVGIDIATGEWITFVDSDDWVKKNMCKTAFDKAVQLNTDILIWDYYLNINNKKVRNHFFRPKLNLDKPKEFFQFCILNSHLGNERSKTSIGITCCKLYKSKIIKDNNIKFDLDCQFSEDLVFNLHAFELSRKIKYINYPLYYYNRNIKSLTNAYRDNWIDVIKTTISKFQIYIDKYNKDKFFYKLIDYRTIVYVSFLLNSYFFHRDNPICLKIKLTQLSLFLKSPPFRESINNVDTSLLSNKQKIFLFFCKKNLVFALYMLSKAKKLLDLIDTLKIKLQC